MFKIQTLNTISAAGLEEFPHELYAISAEHTDPDAILVRSYAMHEMAIPASVKVIGRAGAGLNNIPLETLTKKGIPVFNTPGANANAVRELVLAGMLLASRHICSAWHYVNSLPATEEALHHEIEQHKKDFVGTELMGKTLGIIGLGSVGVKVANAANYLGMKVIGYDPAITVNNAWELSAQVSKAQSLQEVLMSSDFVSLHVPLVAATTHLLNSNYLQLMKPNAVLLNFARHAIVDNKALIAILNERKYFSYVTDFPCVELKGHPQVIALPHLGASTKEAEENCAIMIAKQVRAFLENGSIINAVNFPSIEAPLLIGNVRLAIVNANIPNMVAQISAKLATGGLNILSLLNKSLNDIAYTLIDVNQEIKEDLLKQIEEIEGVVQVRKLMPTA